MSEETKRAISLHKMIRLISFTLGGEGYLNFIGNEWGHPGYIEFPSEHNGDSYYNCRRLWPLLYDKKLIYGELGEFDREML